MEALSPTKGAISVTNSLLSIRQVSQAPISFPCLPKPRKLSLAAPARCSASIRSSDGLAQSQEASRLKQELFLAVEATYGSLDDNCLAIVSSLEKLSLVPDMTLDPKIVKGSLVQVKAKFKENRTDGEKRFLGYLGSISTLGATTFNMLKPVDLGIALFNTYQHVAIESDNSYSLILEFTIPSPVEKAPPVAGLIINRARFRVGGPKRFEIEFLSCGMKPRYPEKDLDLWVKTLKESNPGMAENGSVDVPLPMPVQGWSDLLYMDEEMRIQRGNRGGVSILKLLKETAVSI